MTAQISERLVYEGQTLSLLSNPLTSYFAKGGHSPDFAVTSTALRRGYVGTWEVLGDRLYLVKLEGTLKSGEEANLETVFPGFPDRVFAHWFTGQLRVPRGKQLKYVHQGYASTFEQDLLLDVQDGVLVGSEIRHNGVAQPDAPNGYGVNAMVTFPVRPEGKQP